MAGHIGRDLGPLVFPIEIWLMILEHTTPTAFIAFSQSCRAFRGMTMPDRHHFVQRLLELELDPIEGGGIPIFNLLRVSTPSRLDDESWASMRFACAGCLKLKSHRAFGNHTILSLRQRKPRLDAPAAQMLAEPGDARMRMRRHRAREGASQQQHSERKNPIYPGYSNVRLWEDRKREWELQGIERHRRLCIDCWFLRACCRRRPQPSRLEKAAIDRGQVTTAREGARGRTQIWLAA